MKNIMTEGKEAEQSLQDAIAILPQEMTPERDLWSGVEKAISQNVQTGSSEQSTKTFMPMAWAASVVAAVLLTWVTLGPVQVDGKAPINLVSAMQDDFKQQKRTMLASFGKPDVEQLPTAMQTELVKLNSAQETISKGAC